MYVRSMRVAYLNNYKYNAGKLKFTETQRIAYKVASNLKYNEYEVLDRVEGSWFKVALNCYEDHITMCISRDENGFITIMHKVKLAGSVFDFKTAYVNNKLVLDLYICDNYYEPVVKEVKILRGKVKVENKYLNNARRRGLNIIDRVVDSVLRDYKKKGVIIKCDRGVTGKIKYAESIRFENFNFIDLKHPENEFVDATPLSKIELNKDYKIVIRNGIYTLDI